MGFDAFAVEDAVAARAVGADLFADATEFVGPLPPLPGREADGPVLVVRRTIYVPLPADPADNFGRPDTPNPACGDPCAYNLTRGTILWGLVASEVLVRALDSSSTSSSNNTASARGDPSSLTPAASALRALSSVGYAYRLTAGNGVVVAFSEGANPRDPVTAVLDLPGSEWKLQVWQQAGSWEPAWLGGSLAAVMLLSATAAVLLAGMLVSRRRHALLLEALLPRALLKELSATHAETLGPAGPLDAATSPAGLLLELLGSLLEGAVPDLRQVVLLRSLVLRQADWYHPLGVAQAIKGAHLESDVARALMRQLGTSTVADSDFMSTVHDFGQTDEEDEGAPGLKRRCDGAAGGDSGDDQFGGWDLAGDCGRGGGFGNCQGFDVQQQERMCTLRGALAFVLSTAAQGLPSSRPGSQQAQVVWATGAGGQRSLDAIAATVAASSGSSRRRRPSQLGVQQSAAAGGAGASAGGGNLAARQSVPLSASAARAAVSGADIAVLPTDLAAAAELLDTTDEVDETAFGLRSYPPHVPRPAAPALHEASVSVQPAAQQQLRPQPVPLSSSSVSFVGLVMDSPQATRSRRRLPVASASASALPAGSSRAVGRGSKDMAGPVADRVNECGAASPSGNRLLHAAAGLLVGRRAPRAVGSSIGSPRAQLALLPTGNLSPQPPTWQPKQAHALTATHPSLIGPCAGATGADVKAAAAAGSRLLHSLHSLQLHKLAQPPASMQSTPVSAAGAATAAAADRGRRGSMDTAHEAHQQPHHQYKQAASSPRSQPASAASARVLQEQQAPHQGNAASDAATGGAPVGPQSIMPSAPSSAFMARLVGRWPGVARKISGTGDGAADPAEARSSSRHRSMRSVSGDEMAAAAAAEVLGEEDVVLQGVARTPPAPAVPAAALLDKVEQLLAGAHEWQFDMWALAEASGGHALSVMGFYLMQREGLVAAFRVHPVRLARLLRALEDGYPASNPYHNATHAADVLRTLSVLLRGAQLTAHYAHGLGLLASYFAAIIHDHGHPGLTGDFLVATSHPLALRYNDRSPLESHHAASAFTLLSERPDLDPFVELSKEQRGAFRKQVIDMVLATDMKQHFSLLTQFTSLQKARRLGLCAGGTGRDLGSSGKDFAGTMAAAAGETPSRETQQQAGPQQRALRPPLVSNRAGAIMSAGSNIITELKPAPSRTSFSSLQQQGSSLLPLEPAPSPQDDIERSITLQIALKAADIGHLAGALPVHCRRLGVLEEEFFRQGDRERALGLPISPLFDRTKQGVSKSQVGFFDFVALPLVRALAEAFPGAAPLATCFERNYDHWRQVEAEAATQRQAQQQ
ncbi:hypothetical protein HYH02_012504 [Chlamydomonas schloesseri]|uniref:PDEase domain-containing protein n=1 Tax=Chlamydomonas schloesseri TaxID=2026947 RepID=A0A835VZS8_9CHLO|nr:hypothetical protein HYH02_012504 [Chlamydomonas schloesseri]|eukprot:KAG2433960.1 hypothetical protein HYH02_012504 [Chlamydomonas schloesseri]